MGNATSLFNLMRNIGASIGIASVTTILTRHEQVHINSLGQHVTALNPPARSLISSMRGAMMAQGSDPSMATRKAYASVFGMVQRQAAMMSFNDVFWLLTIIFASMFPLIFLMGKPKHGKGPIAMH